MDQYNKPQESQPEQQPTAMTTPQSAPARQPRHQKVHSLLSNIGLLLLAPILAVALTIFVFQSYQVDGPSMEQTLQNNDRLIVWKLPRTWARLTGHQYVPERGDIIILNESGLANYGNADNTKQLVKRVVGLPGDRVVVRDGMLTIYNAAHPDGFQPDKTLPYGKNGAIPPTTTDLDVQLSATQLFVCGDNRPDSLDSRTFGPIETNQVIGKLVMRILPLTTIKLF